MYTYYIIFFNYVVQFGLVSFFIMRGDGSDCVWKAGAIMSGANDIVLFVQMYWLDLNKQHEEIFKTID